MEAAGASQTYVHAYKTMYHHIKEGCNFHIHYCENLKSQMYYKCAQWQDLVFMV